MVKKCTQCNGEYKTYRQNQRFCSRSCSTTYLNINNIIPRKKTGEYKKCSYCGADKWVMRCLIKNNKGNFYCSREHQIKYLKENAFTFPCKVCSKPIQTQPAQLRLRARSTCSPECRRRLARQLAEDRRKKFGYTKHQLYRLARYSVEMKEWRKSVFERDDYTCKFCGVRGSYLEADHIKPFAYFPDLRTELSNGRTLCRECHDKTKISAAKMKKIYSTELKQK